MTNPNQKIFSVSIKAKTTFSNIKQIPKIKAGKKKPN
jgi:hypothetical protein